MRTHLYSEEDEQFMLAALLLMREVMCEKIYRERHNWNKEHPNNSLRVRDINMKQP